MCRRTERRFASSTEQQHQWRATCWRVPHSLTLVNTKKASSAEQTEWNGETHIGPQRNETQSGLLRRIWTRAWRGRGSASPAKSCVAAKTWRSQTRKRDLRPLSSLAMVESNTLAVNTSRRNETKITPNSSKRLVDPSAELQFKNRTAAVGRHEGAKHHTELGRDKTWKQHGRKESTTKPKKIAEKKKGQESNGSLRARGK